MKKVLLFSIVALLISCTSPLDKKVSVTNLAKDMEQIKSKTTTYTQKDYNIAEDNLAMILFGATLAGEKNTLDVTYREILDQAKAERQKKEKDLEEWQEQSSKLKEVFDLQVVSGKYVNESSKYYPDRYYFDVIITTGDKAIAAIEGKIEFSNDVGDILFTKYIKEALELDANQSEEAEIYALLDSDDNLVEAKVLPFEKMQTEWIPSLIILQDGSRITIPRKP